MNKMKMKYLTGIILVLLVVIGILIFGYFKSDCFGEKPVGTLMSITAENGVTINEDDREGCFELVMHDADHIVFFSDRPLREASRVHPEMFLETWEREFVDNPPNADLEVFDNNRDDEIVIVTLESTPIWDEGTKTFTFKNACVVAMNTDEMYEEDQLLIAKDFESVIGGDFERGSLFIDSISFPDSGVCASGGPRVCGVVNPCSPRNCLTTRETFRNLCEAEYNNAVDILERRCTNADIWNHYQLQLLEEIKAHKK